MPTNRNNNYNFGKTKRDSSKSSGVLSEKCSRRPPHTPPKKGKENRGEENQREATK